jgi:hypothetical protein
MLELSKVFNGSETFGTLQIAKACAKKRANDGPAQTTILAFYIAFKLSI